MLAVRSSRPCSGCAVTSRMRDLSLNGLKFGIVAFCVIVALPSAAMVYFVDSAEGNDLNDGKSPESAWRSLGKVNSAAIRAGDTVRFRRGGLWRGTLVPHSGEPGRPVTYATYGHGPKPIFQNSVDRSGPSDWIEEGPGLWSTQQDEQSRRDLSKDVGILIVNHGERWGVKKWHNSQWEVPQHGVWPKTVRMENELDFFYDSENSRVVVKCLRNPGKAYDSIELALTEHVVNEAGRHDVTYDGLWIRYGAAHGFGGGSVVNIVIRNCDISWIGGGFQYWRKDEKTDKIRNPVRFGNGVEFWGNCQNCLVERCRLWEIYDAAVTNQGFDHREAGIVWRDNVIWNSEYSYEYWNGGVTCNVVFEHNTCVDAGFGWAHDQRPDPNGSHLLYYVNRAATTNFVVRNNIFCRATEWTVRAGNDWRKSLTHDGNLVFNEDKVPVMRWLDGKRLALCAWQDYVALGLDKNGRFAEPRFRNPSKRDYRLRPDSPGLTSSDGQPVGARGIPGLDEDQSVQGGLE